MTWGRAILYLFCRTFRCAVISHPVVLFPALFNGLQIGKEKNGTHTFSLFHNIVTFLKQWSIYLELFSAKMSKCNCHWIAASSFPSPYFWNPTSLHLFLCLCVCHFSLSTLIPVATPPLVLMSLHAFLILKKENECFCLVTWISF